MLAIDLYADLILIKKQENLSSALIHQRLARDWKFLINIYIYFDK